MIFNKECKDHEKNKAYIQSISKGDNSRRTDGRTGGRSGTFACTLHFSDGRLSIYQVSFNAFLYFQRYDPDKLFIAKIKKGSNSVNTCGGICFVLFFFCCCFFLHSAIYFIVLYQCIKFHLFIFNTSRDMLRTSLLLQKLEREITLQFLVIELRFLHSALPLMAAYQCIKFYLIPFNTFRDMLRIGFYCKN